MSAVHRDIAARNVLVAADGKTVKLSDFGMSRFLTSDYYRMLDGNVFILTVWMFVRRRHSLWAKKFAYHYLSHLSLLRQFV